MCRFAPITMIESLLIMKIKELIKVPCDAGFISIPNSTCLRREKFKHAFSALGAFYPSLAGIVLT